MKETKPYDLPKEGPKNIVSEPMAEYQSMSSLQLEADKARLIRAIVNIDSKLVFDKVKQRLRDILNLREEVVVEPEPDSKEWLKRGIPGNERGKSRKKSIKTSRRTIERTYGRKGRRG